MKKLAVIGIAATLLFGTAACSSTPEPKPEPTKTQTAEECYKEAFEVLKKEYGVKFLIDQKEQANAIVRQVCSE